MATETRLGCKLCIAAHGLRASDIDKLPKTEAEYIQHLVDVHGVVVRNDGCLVLPGPSGEELVASPRDGRQAARPTDKTAPPYRRGVDVIMAGECPLGQLSPFACMWCLQGHAMECHYPMDCEAANCGHYQQDQAFEEESGGH